MTAGAGGPGAVDRRLLGCRPALLAVAVFLAVSTAYFCWASPATAKTWRVEAMHVTLDVQTSGDVAVSEEVTFAFEGHFSYVARVIPAEALEGIEDVQVLEEGRPLPRGSSPGTYDVFAEDGNLVVQLAFDLADTSKTWTIRYVAEAAVAYHGDGDELVWHVFDADTPVPIDRVSATVRLPGAVPTDDLDWAVDTGVNVRSTVSGPAPSTVVFDAQEITPHTKYWIAVGFPKGVVKYTWTARRLATAAVPRAGFLLPIATFLVMLVVWFRRGRDEPAAAYARYATEPPSSLSPASAGALLDERVESRELFATLADLARRGYLELPQSHADRNSWAVRKLKTIQSLEGPDDFVASKLFAAGDDRVKPPMLQNRLAAIGAGFGEAVFKDLLQHGFFDETPAAARRRWKRRASALALLLLVVTVMLALIGIGGWGYFAVGSAVSVAVAYGFARVMPQRTHTGAQERRRWEAFRNYLDDLTEFADLAAAQETFERYLPYAVAFGVEKRWVRRFRELLIALPPWLGPVAEPKAHRPPDSDDKGGPAPGGQEPRYKGGAAGSIGVGDLTSGLPTVTLSSVSDHLFSGFDRLSDALTSAPSSSGTGRDAFGTSRVTGHGSHGSSSQSSFSGSHSSSSGGGGFSSGGGGGGGFRAG